MGIIRGRRVNGVLKISNTRLGILTPIILGCWRARNAQRAAAYAESAHLSTNKRKKRTANIEIHFGDPETFAY
jgi:hypothetical protein